MAEVTQDDAKKAVNEAVEKLKEAPTQENLAAARRALDEAESVGVGVEEFRDIGIVFKDVPMEEPLPDGIRIEEVAVTVPVATEKKDPLDALDVLIPQPPKVEPRDGEVHSRVLAARAAQVQAEREAIDDLTHAVEAFAAGVGSKEVVADAVARAEARGVKVNRVALVRLGAIDAEPEPNIDAAPEPPVEPEAKELPEADPLALATDARGHILVPMYNPTPAVLEPMYNGDRYPVRPNGIDFVRLEAADAAVGVENMGGPMSRYGLRRLYGPEERFAEAAAAEGLSIVEWCQRRNAGIQMLSDGLYAQIAPAIEEQLLGADEKLGL